MTREVIDIEANNLLTHETIDYTASPYKLKPNFKIWCLVQRNVDDPSIVKKYVGLDEIKAWAMWELPKITEFIGHNILDFDLLALKLLGLLKYEISNEFGKPSTINGKPVKITDTLVLSKCLNPDRYGGHSLDEWGKRVGSHKVDWRAQAIELGLITHSAPKGAEFQQWHPKMGDYCEQDTLTNVHALNKLIAEMGDWDWSFPLWLEHIVRDIVTRQSHRGFWFDKELADSNIRDLDRKMAEIKAIVEPLLPPKPLGKTALKEFYPPKIQFKKDGTVSAVLQKWIAKHGGIIKPNSLYEDGPPFVEVYGREWVLPLDTSVAVKTHGPAEITDTTFIKGWLVELGWKPTQYKERDLTCDAKKNKLSDEKFKEAVERYVEQTLASPFCKDRCNELDTTPGRLREYLLKRGNKRPMKVYTNPTITVGMEKEIDPALLDLADKFPHAKLVSEYLTYAHRRNSILGGGVDPDDVDDDDEFAGKGFIAAERIAEDGRIPTPADSCGAGTSRFKHRLVANIPRVTSLYGDKMRAMFGVNVADGFIQLGYDFDSLEAKIEAHYVYKYPGGPEYGVSLTAEKPNDCHSVLARKISALLGREFPRAPAKNVKYGCVPMHTLALTKAGWKRYEEMSEGDEVLGYNPVTGKKEWTRIKKLFSQESEVIEFGHSWFKVQATRDHRWYVKQRKEFKSGNSCKSVRKAVDEVRLTDELNSESNIIVNAPMAQDLTTWSLNRPLADSKRETDWQSRVMTMTQSERQAFLEGFMIADGYEQNGKWQWSQNRGELAEAALLASYLVHDGVVQVRDAKSPTNPMMNVLLSKKPHRTLQTMTRKSLGEQQVWCMETELGSWVMRQGDVITITGNCSYGAMPPRVAKTIGCSLEDGKVIWDAFWEAAAPLNALKERMEMYWEKKGEKKFVPGVDGRKLPIRSKSNLINSGFQSAGVICAKLAMVLHERYLKQEGMWVDFFSDDWRNKDFCQQLIAYHDEAQLEVRRSMVTWKKFESEEACKAFKSEDGKVWSDPVHNSRGWFRGYCRAGELATIAVREAGRYFKLNVELSAGYMLGTNWASCH